MSRKRMDLVLEDLAIDKIAAEGKAVAHYEGQVVFIEGGVPGDVVRARVIRKKKNYLEASILEVVRPSKDRLEPFCPHFGTCGGCKWQQLPYPMQLEAKQQQVWDQLVRIGHLTVPPIEPILPSDKTVFYRNKLEFTFSNKRWILRDEDPEQLSADERKGLGFHVGRFFDKVLDIRQCSLQAEPSNAIRLFIKSYALEHGMEFFDIRENRGFLRNMFIRSNRDGDFMLIVCFFRDDPPLRTSLLDAVSEEFSQIKSIYYVINSKLNDSITDQECHLYKGEATLAERMENLTFRIGPKSFYQTNGEQALKLYRTAREFAALTGNETVYDLYTGTGTIAQFVSAGAAKVIGIEYVEEAIADARRNAAANGITNCFFHAGDMKDILTPAFIRENGQPDVVILDPPRAGIHPEVARVLLEAAPRRIVYVSCNPASQARDLAVLCSRYRITRVRPVDMFPHTQHVENVCCLEILS